MMNEEMKARLESTLREILEESDLTKITVNQLLKFASEKLNLDLSQPSCKAFVRQVAKSYFYEHEAKQAPKEEDEKAEGDTKPKEFDDNGDQVICRLSTKRKVTIQKFDGKPLICIREFYVKNGKEHYNQKGINLPPEQWSIIKKHISAVDKAVEEMESRM